MSEAIGQPGRVRRFAPMGMSAILGVASQLYR
jgi:hypothetical protein